LAGVHFRALLAPVTVRLHGAKSWQLRRWSVAGLSHIAHAGHGQPSTRSRRRGARDRAPDTCGGSPRWWCQTYHFPNNQPHVSRAAGLGDRATSRRTCREDRARTWACKSQTVAWGITVATCSTRGQCQGPRIGLRGIEPLQREDRRVLRGVWERRGGREIRVL